MNYFSLFRFLEDRTYKVIAMRNWKVLLVLFRDLCLYSLSLSSYVLKIKVLLLGDVVFLIAVDVALLPLLWRLDHYLGY